MENRSYIEQGLPSPISCEWTILVGDVIAYVVAVLVHHQFRVGGGGSESVPFSSIRRDVSSCSKLFTLYKNTTGTANNHSVRDL